MKNMPQVELVINNISFAPEELDAINFTPDGKTFYVVFSLGAIASKKANDAINAATPLNIKFIQDGITLLNESYSQFEFRFNYTREEGFTQQLVINY